MTKAPERFLLKPVEHEVALGREVVVERPDAHVRGPRRIPHRQLANATLEEERAHPRIDLALAKNAVLPWSPGFSERHARFL
jgi:hypothetical protein